MGDGHSSLRFKCGNHFIGGKNEFNLSNLILAFFMLFTYAKLWVLVVLNGVIQGMQDAVYHKEVIWDKTERFEEVCVKEINSQAKEAEN